MENLNSLGLTVEKHARLSVQTQANAMYITKKFMERLNGLNWTCPRSFPMLIQNLGSSWLASATTNSARKSHIWKVRIFESGFSGGKLLRGWHN